MTGLLFVSLTVTWWWFLAPRVWSWCDTHVARERLSGTSPAAPGPAAESWRPARLRQLSTACRHAARAQRSGAVVGVALAEALTEHCSTSFVMNRLATDLTAAVPLQTALTTAVSCVELTGDEARMLSLLVAGNVESMLPPASLDRTADVLDDLVARRADVHVAAAHAALTVRFLTALPLGVGALALVVSPSLRSSLTHPAVAAPVVIGGILHLVGRLVVRRTVARVSAAAHEPPGAASRLADTISAGLAAGLTPAAVCARLDVDPSCGVRASSVADAVRRGAPLADALAPLLADRDTVALAAAVLAVAREGTGGAVAAAQLADASRRDRAERTREAVAALPGQLAVPVTIFVLPSFLVGVLVPVVATGAQLA